MEVLEDKWPGEDVNNEGMGLCSYLESHLLFYSYWWVFIILQILAIFPLVIFSVCILDPCTGREDGSSLLGGEATAEIYVQASFWLWLIYLISSGTCGIAADDPLMITGIIFVILAYLTHWSLVCQSDEDKAIRRRNTVQELHNYFETAKNMSPRDQISGTAYHYEHEVDHNGKRKSVKRSSYVGEETFIYDKWIDQSEFPDIGPITKENPITIVAFTFECEPGDSYTADELETFKSNYKSYVEQLDSNTGKFRHWIQVLVGSKSETFRTTFVKKNKKEEDDNNEDNEDKDEKEQNEKKEDKQEALDEDDSKHIFSVTGDGNFELPWYMNKTLLLFLNMLCMSFLLKVMINIKAKKYHFVIKKLFFSDPRNPKKNYTFISAPVMPYMGPGRDQMPLVSSTQPTGVYARTNKTVVQKPFALADTLLEKNALISYFEDIKRHSDCKNY